ncbi:MAG: hypothetical protein H6704_10600 [Myxococcales bacterium]|nr:hypothetical protein [Myxococcales bacterium]
MNPIVDRLRPALPGLVLAILTVLFGQGLGLTFGVAEDRIKDRLKGDAAAVLETVYAGDQAKADAVTSKAWSYMKRAHLHAGGMGTTALALATLVALLGVGALATRLVGVGLGLGGLGYSVFWMWAGFRAPGLGSTGAAKASLEWLAMPSAGAFVLCTLAALALVIRALTRRASS